MNLAEHIAAHAYSDPEITDWWLYPRCACGWEEDEPVEYEDETVAAHAEHVAESWAEHRTVTTVADGLDLPDGTVLRDAEGEVHPLHAPSPTPISLPARVLHNPKEDQ